MTEPVVWTEKDFAAALDLMRECNEYAPPKAAAVRGERPSSPAGTGADGERVGDVYNRQADWADILEPHGWTVAGVRGDVTFWTRPGKDRGISASTGFCKGEKTGSRLYVFTTNAPGLEPMTSYSKLWAYAALAHHGDATAAVRELAKRYAPPPSVQPTVVIGPAPAERPTDPDDDVAGINDLKRAGAAVRWVWPGWIQRGVVTCVAAQGGTGKTRFSADLVRRVTHGLPWPDGTPTEGHDGKAVALWVVADNHHDEMVTLSESFGIVESVRVNASRSEPYDGVTLELLEDFAALERRVKAVQPLFVFVDTVGNATDKNMSRQEDAKAFYQPLQLIARRCNVAVVALTHLNAGGKALGRRVMEKVRTCIRLSAEKINETSCKRRLEVIKSNSAYPKPLGVAMGGEGNEYDDDPPPPPEDQDGGGQAAGSTKGPATTPECVAWLRDQLAAGPQYAGALLGQAEAAGFDKEAVFNAATAIKVVRVKVKGKMQWSISLVNDQMV